MGVEPVLRCAESKGEPLAEAVQLVIVLYCWWVGWLVVVLF